MARPTEEEFLRKLGLTIRCIRNEKGLSLNQLATQYGFEKANLSRLEAGKANITLKTVYKLSIALDVPISRIFAG